MIAVIGEALIDLVGDGRVFRAQPGGSPCNVAVGLARLDVPSALLARLSGDAFGDQLRAHLDRNGVSLRHAVVASEPTTLAFALLDSEGSATYEFYVHGTADWQWRDDELPSPLPAEVDAIHAGSLALALDPGATVLEKYLRQVYEQGQVTVSLDPNVRPQLATDRDRTRRRIEEQLACAHLVKASAEDFGWLYPGEPLGDVVRRWHTLGPAVVIATMGSGGALALGPGDQMVHVPAPTVRVVDTVGAGDAFTSAVLARLAERDLLRTLRSADAAPGAATSDRALPLLDGDVLRDVLARGCTAAALTCGRPGADPPTAAELAESRS